MSNFQNLVINRRSIRKYKDEEIGAEAVKTIIETALMSPSSKNKMPWEFIVVEDRQTLAQLKECKDFGTKGLETCPLAVVVAANPETSDAWIEDASVATLMMQLQAADMGLGSCWIQVRDRYREDGTPAEEFVRNTNKNKLSDANIENILSLLKNRVNVENKAILVPNEDIADNDYNISVNSYLKTVTDEVEIDIVELNKSIEEIVAKQSQVRKELDAIIRELESDYHE